MLKNSQDDIIEGHLHCPRCQTVLLEKIPQDERQIREVVRFFCPCGYYKDIPIKEANDIGKGLIG